MIAIDCTPLFGNGGIPNVCRRYLEEFLLSTQQQEICLICPRKYDTRIFDRMPFLTQYKHSIYFYDDVCGSTFLGWVFTIPLLVWRFGWDQIIFFGSRVPYGIRRQVSVVCFVHDICFIKAPKTMRTTGWILDAVFGRKALARSNFIVTLTNSVKSELIDHYPKLVAPILVLKPGCSKGLENFLEGKLAVNDLNSSKFLLMVGTFEPRKNHAKLIEAFSRCRARNECGLGLVIVGFQGWGGVNPKKISREFGCDEHVNVITNASDEMIYELIDSCWAIVMPSVYEGCGLPVIDALYAGKPVIASRIDAAVEVAGVAGIFFPRSNTELMAKTIDRLYYNEGLFYQLSTGARVQRLTFSWESRGSVLAEFIGA